MLSVGKISRSENCNLTVDGLEVLAIEWEKTEKTWDGFGLLLSTDAGDYLYNYSGDLKAAWELSNSDVVDGCDLLLSFVPFNYNR